MHEHGKVRIAAVPASAGWSDGWSGKNNASRSGGKSMPVKSTCARVTSWEATNSTGVWRSFQWPADRKRQFRMPPDRDNHSHLPPASCQVPNCTVSACHAGVPSCVDAECYQQAMLLAHGWLHRHSAPHATQKGHAWQAAAGGSPPHRARAPALPPPDPLSTAQQPHHPANRSRIGMY